MLSKLQNKQQGGAICNSKLDRKLVSYQEVFSEKEDIVSIT